MKFTPIALLAVVLALPSSQNASGESTDVKSGNYSNQGNTDATDSNSGSKKTTGSTGTENNTKNTSGSTFNTTGAKNGSQKKKNTKLWIKPSVAAIMRVEFSYNNLNQTWITQGFHEFLQKKLVELKN
jgi:hypothetical protein